MTADRMTPKEGRERLVIAALNRQRSAVEGWYVPVALAEAPVDAILATTDALAVLLDWHELGKRATAEQLTALLRGAEKAGRVEHVGYQWLDPGYGPDGGLMEKHENQSRTSRMHPLWRIVPDEEGAT